jgi:outer membrane protein insertion porin family
MRKVYQLLLLAVIFCSIAPAVYAQDTDTTVTSVDVDLLHLFTQKTSKKYKIAGIKVTGNKYFDETLLLSISTLSVGQEISIPGGDQFAKAITKLWAQNYFSDVKIYVTKLEGKNIYIEINVTERPRLSKYFVLGTNITKGDRDDLQGKMGLISNRVVTENMKRSAKEAIIKYFDEKGYQNVGVRIEEKKDSSFGNSLILYFYVDKGGKTKVNEIAITGNTIDALKLKKEFKDTKERSRFSLHKTYDSAGFASPQVYTFNQYLQDRGYLTYSKTKKVLDPYVRLKLFTSSKFNQKKYDDDKQKLIEYYNSLGYRDFNIDKDTIVRRGANINIGIKLTEGHKYYFGNITWRGNTKYSDSILSVVLGIHKGDIYNIDRLNRKLGKTLTAEGGDISGLYMDDGYLFFRTDPVETAVYNDTIDYEIRISEGTQAVWKNVNITGNEKTKEYVIRRELRTLPGNIFRRSDLIRTQRELSQLNFFNQEKINPNVVPHPEDGTVDVTWQLEEKSSDQLELSAGWGGGIGLTGTVGVSFNNFSLKNIFKKGAWDPIPMGDGQKVSFRVQSNGRAYRSYNFSFTEPWLGGKKRNALTFAIFDTKFANAYDPVTRSYTSAAANNSYIKTTGGSLTLGKPLKWPDDYFSISFGLSYARYTLKNYYIDQTNLPGFNNGNSNNISLKIALQRSSVNQPLFPTGGSSQLFSLQITPPYSLIDETLTTKSNPYQFVEYHKWRFNTEWYIPLTNPGTGESQNKQLVLKMAGKFGFMGRFNSKLEISPFERFQLGDAGLSNQYALLGYDIISQRGYPVYQTSDPKVNPDQSGASQYFTMFNKYVLELRYPLSLNPSSTIYVLGFYEAANGWYSFKDYNPFRLRRSVGLGMRFYLPMFGLLGFDYGVGLDRIPTGSTSINGATRFTFMLGFEPE